jgi:ATP-binding cassette subfamily C (CFTR/MRP) protein 4
VTLSGGQKARLSLARSLYCDADVYLLDDPLSAVDTAVGNRLFKAIKQYTRSNKSCLLVTHQLQYLQDCDDVVVVDNGKIVAAGLSGDILDYGKAHAGGFLSSSKFDSKMETGGPASSARASTIALTADVAADVRKEDQVEVEETNHLTQTELVQEERAIGHISLGVYSKYFNTGTGSATISVLLVFLLVMTQVSYVATDYWLSTWTTSPVLYGSTSDPLFPIVYVCLTAFTALLAILRSLAFFYICVRASRLLFRKMLNSVMSTPVYFFQVLISLNLSVMKRV